MAKYVFGADPGATGGLVRIALDGSKEYVRFGKLASEVEMWTRIRMMNATIPLLINGVPAYIELLQSFGDIDAKRIPRLMQMRENSGILQGMLIAAGCEIIKVQPQVWKREFSLVGVGKTYEDRKKAAHVVAKAEFGDWVTKDIADAMLIAEYGWRKENGKLTGGIKSNGVLRAGTGITRVTGILGAITGPCSGCGVDPTLANCICI